MGAFNEYPQQILFFFFCFVFLLLFLKNKKTLIRITFKSRYLYVMVSFINSIFDLITTHAPICTLSSNLVVFRLQPVFYYLLLEKNIYCGFSFELPRQVEAIQRSMNNICFFFNENQKIITRKHH